MKQRLERITTRMGPDVRDALEAMPGLGGVALWVKFADTEEAHQIAYTDGVTVFAGPRYSQLDTAERRFVLLHELLHVALAHPARGHALAARTEDFDERLYNIATDALINAALEGVRGIRKPVQGVSLEEVLRTLGQWEEGATVKERVRHWSSEALYHALCRQQKDVQSSTWYVRTQSDDLRLRETKDAVSQPSQVELDETLRRWRGRLAMARGVLAGVMERLANELPQVRTPWERVLRDYLFRYARGKRRLDPSRPSRRWLALEHGYRQSAGVDLPFERATTLVRSGRIAIALDTSGSIDEKLLARFVAEVAAILERLNPKVRLIVCDAEVQQILDLDGQAGAQQLRQFKCQGGGGTDFRPALAAASAWQPDLLLYLTDLYGEAGTPPRYPVLWAVPEGYAAPPWGSVIALR